MTELLGGIAGMARERALRKIELQTGLLALLTFLAIVATWIDAWSSLRTVSLDLAGLWSPVLLATSYYLAASVIFPSDPADFEDLAAYYASRKRFVVAMLIAAEVFITFSYREVFAFVLSGCGCCRSSWPFLPRSGGFISRARAAQTSWRSAFRCCCSPCPIGSTARSAG